MSFNLYLGDLALAIARQNGEQLAELLHPIGDHAKNLFESLEDTRVRRFPWAIHLPS